MCQMLRTIRFAIVCSSSIFAIPLAQVREKRAAHRDSIKQKAGAINLGVAHSNAVVFMDNHGRGRHFSCETVPVEHQDDNIMEVNE